MTTSGNIRNTGTHNSARYFGAKPCRHLCTNRPKLRRMRVSVTAPRAVFARHGTGSFGHRVIGSFGSSFTSGSPGHYFHPMWDPSFSGFRKMPKMRNVRLKCWNDKSHCQVSAVELKIHGLCNDLLLLLMIITTSLTWEYFFVTSMRTPLHISRHLEFIIGEGHHSPGQLGLRVAGFPGRWVTGSQNVTSSMSVVRCQCRSRVWNKVKLFF